MSTRGTRSLAYDVSLPAANVLCSSPQLATPRRSLFTANLFQQLDTRGKLLCDGVGTRTSADVL